MATDIRYPWMLTIEQWMQAANLSYSPVALAINKRNQFAVNLDSVTFKEMHLEKGSAVAEILNPEQTEIRHIKAAARKRAFTPYAMGAKFIQSTKGNGVNEIQKLHDEVLREYSMHWDRLAINGDGHGNNGLLKSTDEFYITRENFEIPKKAVGGSDFDRAEALKEQLVDLALQIDDFTAATDLTVYVYGRELRKFLSKSIKERDTSFEGIVREAFKGKNVRWIPISKAVLPSDAGNGFVVLADNLVTLDYTIIPRIEDQGVNAENHYYYANYTLGAVQVAADVEGAIIKQPVTFAMAE